LVQVDQRLHPGTEEGFERAEGQAYRIGEREGEKKIAKRGQALFPLGVREKGSSQGALISQLPSKAPFVYRKITLRKERKSQMALDRHLGKKELSRLLGWGGRVREGSALWGAKGWEKKEKYHGCWRRPRKGRSIHFLRVGGGKGERGGPIFPARKRGELSLFSLRGDLEPLLHDNEGKLFSEVAESHRLAE